MYLDFLVDIPSVEGKITNRSKGNSTYVNYEIDRVYNPENGYNVPKRVTIGKLSKQDPGKMVPNQNFRLYFPEVELPDEKYNSERSGCLKIGSYIVIRSIMEEYNLSDILGRYFDDKGLGLFLDLVAYSIATENNAGQYYPMYAYSRPLFTKGMKVYSDSKVSSINVFK